MFGDDGLTFAAGPLYTNAIMGHAPSALEREKARKASSTIVREDSIQVEESEDVISRPESWSLNWDRTDQAPYHSEKDQEKMMTQSSLLSLPKKNPSHDLAFFLRTTGPTAPHRRPSKLEHSKRAVSTSKHAFRFFKVGQKRPPPSVTDAHNELNNVLFYDEGGLMADLPSSVEQKVSSTGKRYLALTIPEKAEQEKLMHTEATPSLGTDGQETLYDAASTNCLPLGSEILESRVSVFFPDDHASNMARDDWFHYQPSNSQRHDVSPLSIHKAPTAAGAEDYDHRTLDGIDYSPSPIRPAASSPPSPLPESATSIAESYRLDLHEHPAKSSMDVARAVSDPTGPFERKAGTPFPNVDLNDNKEEIQARLPNLDPDLDLKHPFPRRIGSHPVLLQRTSSITSSMYARNNCDSPGPPPPRSPLRLRRDPRSIEGTISAISEVQRLTPKNAPSIKSANEFAIECESIIPTVVTECTGPIKRPKSRDKTPVRHFLYPASRKEREEKTRARKLRDRPYIGRTIDAVVNAPPVSPRQRLRKVRPHIQIPDISDLRPAPLATRASSTASSNASWKRVTETSINSVSTISSKDDAEETSTEAGEKTGYTPVSPTHSNGSTSANVEGERSPVTLVAEELALPKAKSTPKPTRLVLSKDKAYSPRPRSASMSHLMSKRRSRNSVYFPSRPGTPGVEKDEDEAPPLPSPPPNRALPPTPPASGSERVKKGKSSKTSSPADGGKKDVLAALLPCEISTHNAILGKTRQQLSHVATQDQRVGSLRAWNREARIHARLAALEKHNALLEAALMAVLKTNGALNGPLSNLMLDPESPKSPMTWESRVTRRSEASHTASSSNGSALEMYMSTRRGSKAAME